MITEDIQYCTYCGAANKKSAVECVECQRKIHTTYRPFYDFLKKHIKDELKGKMTDSALSVIKRFLLSHVYGIAISVSVVASVAATVYSAGGITKVTEQRVAPVSSQNILKEEDEKQEFQQLNADEIYELSRIITSYDGFVDNLRSSDRYWEADDSYSGAGDLYAENNIAGFSYGGVHEMIANPIDMYSLDYDDEMMDKYRHFYSDRYLDEGNIVTGDACTSDIAKKLIDDGYRVAEGNYVMCEAADNYDYETHSGSDVIKKLVYRVVMVEHYNQWYMAEDRLIQKTGF